MLRCFSEISIFILRSTLLLLRSTFFEACFLIYVFEIYWPWNGESIRLAKSQQVPLQSYLQTSNTFQSNTPDRSNKENWQTLRQKKDQKGKILDLQSALQGELQKRMGVEEDLMRAKRQIEELEQDLVEARLKNQELEQASYHQVKYTCKIHMVNIIRTHKSWLRETNVIVYQFKKRIWLHTRNNFLVSYERK